MDPVDVPFVDAADPTEGGGSPLLTVAGVARRLGVAPATLRTWDRRYGLGPSDHPSGAHRRYSSDDMARLLVMRRLVVDGVAPAEAARLALEAPAPDESRRAGDDAADASERRLSRGRNRGSGEAVAEVVDLVAVGDERAVERALALGSGDDVLVWWQRLVEPAAAALARRTVVDRPGVDAAATLEGAALAALRAFAPVAGAPGARPVVLVVAHGASRRPLVVHVVAAALVAGGVDARIVGGPVSGRHVVELVVMTRAAAVVTATTAATPSLRTVERLARERPDVPQFVMVSEEAAGAVPLDRSVHRARTASGVVHEVLAAVGAAAPWSSVWSSRSPTSPETGQIAVVAPG